MPYSESANSTPTGGSSGHLLRVAAVVALVTTIAAIAAGEVRVINVDPDRVIKDISASYIGVDAETHATGADMTWMLTDGRDESAKYARLVGLRRMRICDVSRYSFRGEYQTRLLWAKKYAPGNPKKQKRIMAKPVPWFDPEELFSFCKEHGIRLIPMFNSKVYYDADDGVARPFIDKPEYYEAAAKEAAAYVKWVKDHGYSDVVAAWEIGNELFDCWDPRELAKYVKLVIRATRQVDPDVKLALDCRVVTPDNPDAKALMARIRADGPGGGTWLRDVHYRQAKRTLILFEELGEEARHITYGIVHVYGADSSWTCNYKGLDAPNKLLQSLENTKHMRMIVTEWRARSSEDWVCQPGLFTNSMISSVAQPRSVA